VYGATEPGGIGKAGGSIAKFAATLQPSIAISHTRPDQSAGSPF
jgi:hypothetical protein